MNYLKSVNLQQNGLDREQVFSRYIINSFSGCGDCVSFGSLGGKKSYVNREVLSISVSILTSYISVVVNESVSGLITLT